MKIVLSAVTRGVLVMSVVALAACQPLRGTWYYQKEPRNVPIPRECNLKSRSCLYLSVFNDSKSVLTVDGIDVYSQLPSDLPFIDNRSEFWRCRARADEGAETAEYVLHPGQLVVLTLPHEGEAACRIPMDARLLLREGRDSVRVRIAATHPNSIPSAWLGCPSRPPEIVSEDTKSKQTEFRCKAGKSGDTATEGPRDVADKSVEYVDCLAQPFVCEVAGLSNPKPSHSAASAAERASGVEGHGIETVSVAAD